MSEIESMVGKWTYGNSPSHPYGGDNITYEIAMKFLDGPYIIEDWGCGTAWARQFVKQGRYIGVDGSWSMYRDIGADLVTYKSKVGAILIRHILEHNFEWKKILGNALESFEKKMTLITFTQFSDTTHQIAEYSGRIPDLSFCKDDLMELLKPFYIRDETFKTATQYGTETIFFLEKK